jgi:hypothetical protein
MYEFVETSCSSVWPTQGDALPSTEARRNTSQRCWNAWTAAGKAQLRSRSAHVVACNGTSPKPGHGDADHDHQHRIILKGNHLGHEK